MVVSAHKIKIKSNFKCWRCGEEKFGQYVYVQGKAQGVSDDKSFVGKKMLFIKLCKGCAEKESDERVARCGRAIS